MIKHLISSISQGFIAFFIMLGLTSCTGEGNDLANYDEGGIDGSGVTGGSGGGAVTGFGSVIFSDSEFTTNPSTVFTLDGNAVTEADLRVGMVAQFDIAADASSDLSSGTAQRIDAESIVKGIVTSTSPLKVLGQAVVTTNETLLENLPAGLTALSIGDITTVYGFENGENVIQATRIQHNTAMAGTTLTQWKLSGNVSALTPTTLNVGDQMVDIAGVIPENCGAGLQINDRVEIKSDPNSAGGFSQLTLVTEIACDDSGISVPSNPESTRISAEFEGLISAYDFGLGDTQFFVGGQPVDIILAGSSQTIYQGGVIGDLLNGVRVEVEGELDTVSSRLIANKVIFKQSQVELVAPVDPAGIDLVNETFLIMGITVSITAATSDEVGILSGGLSALTQLSVKGQVNGSEIIATEIRDEGVPKFDEVKVQGVVSNEIVGTSFEILSVLINVDGSTTFRDTDDLIINMTEFFNAIDNGVLVELSGDLSTSGPPVVTASEVEVEG